MITRDYRAVYRAAFRQALEQAPLGRYDECTIPSYAHGNRLIAWLFWKRIEAALSLAGDITGASVLDFGCGGGVTFKYLSDRNCRITACENQFFDLAESMAAALNAPVRIHRDLSEIEPQRFDVIFALDVLEHVEDLAGVIDRFLSLSHDRTRIILSGPTESRFYRLGRRLIGYAGQERFHERTIYDVEEAFRSKGLRIEAKRRLYPPVTLFRTTSWVRG